MSGEQQAQSQQPAKKSSVKRWILMLVVPAIGLLAAGYIYLRDGRYVDTDNAYVKADKVQVSAEVAGTVRQVLVEENQQVAAGQLLFKLDAKPFEVAVNKAQSHVAQVTTDLDALKASYQEKLAEISLAKSQYAYQIKEQNRIEGLLKKDYISPANFDDAKQNTELAKLKLEAANKDLQRIAVSLGGSVDLPVEQHPNYLAALAELDEAKLDLARTEVHASMSGMVRIPPKPGQYLNAGQTSMTLVVTDYLWVEANYTETDLTHVSPGQQVTIHIDTYPDDIWQGTVESLSPATSAEFSVLPAQNATGNWVKIAQRVPVKIKIKANTHLPKLRAGLSAITQIDTGFKRQLFGYSL
ncbi:HlyD family secretion protein [Neptunicella marina]|uniref:HlyD family secretion protein n=1 Tax=Neptunicella marina TaxID=2125989 RepID=A0A8J6IW34_9ALTE|nr:HlyD family secretion protein [Neptunicella marina]MBC3766483.1 HlyD family secretion protein [Neptunicella marina]